VSSEKKQNKKKNKEPMEMVTPAGQRTFCYGIYFMDLPQESLK